MHNNIPPQVMSSEAVPI